MFVYLYPPPPKRIVIFFRLQFSACKIPHNPLFINCSKKHDTAGSHSPTLPRPTTTPYTGDLTIKDFRIEKSDRGISIRPGQKLKVLESFLFIPQCKCMTAKHAVLLRQIFTFDMYPYALYNALAFTEYKKILFFVFRLD